MLAAAYLLLVLVCGWRLRVRWLPPTRRLLGSHRVPAWAFDLPAAYVLGTIPVVSLTFFLASATKRFAPGADELLVANTVAVALMATALVFQTLAGRRQIATQVPTLPHRLTRPWGRGRWPRSLFWVCALVAFGLFSWLITFGVLTDEDGKLKSGFSVFSDYATHTALMASFAWGDNYAPTTYPHFAGDGIQYHFFFDFFAGNLAFLGMPLDWALNVPSWLSTVAFFMILGAIAIAWTGRRGAFLLAPALVMFRSGFGGFYYLIEVLPRDAQQLQVGPWEALTRLERFVGNQEHDDWGLWTLNTFANQRHLMFALVAGLVLMSFFLPAFRAGARAPWFGRGAWLPSDWRPYLVASAFVAPFGYWHGSVLIATLLMLAWLAIPSRDKLGYLLVASAAITGAMLMSWLFSGSNGGAVSPHILVGFLSASPTPIGMLTYLAILTGSWLLLSPLAWVWSPSNRHRWLQLALVMPIVFTFTVSLTPDVTVNHKYLLIAIILGAVPVTQLLLQVWHGSRRLTGPQRSEGPHRDARERRGVPRLTGSPWRNAGRRVVVALTVGTLTLSGVVDLIGYVNLNQHAMISDTQTPFMRWLKTETQPRDLFLTPEWSYDAFFLSGRQSWFGHAYYAWSAGHNVDKRFAEFKLLWNGWRAPDAAESDQSEAEAVTDRAFDDYVRGHGIRYALVTDRLRKSTDYVVDEAWFARRFPVAAEFPDVDGLVIYRLY